MMWKTKIFNFFFPSFSLSPFRKIQLGGEREEKQGEGDIECIFFFFSNVPSTLMVIQKNLARPLQRHKDLPFDRRVSSTKLSEEHLAQAHVDKEGDAVRLYSQTLIQWLDTNSQLIKYDHRCRQINTRSQRGRGREDKNTALFECRFHNRSLFTAQVYS